MNYKKAYYKLFNEITDLIESLKELQIEVEEIVTGVPDEEIYN